MKHNDYMTAHSRERGFTLLELLISTTIITIVSALTFVALSNSFAVTDASAAKDEVQSGLRDVMRAIQTEVRAAYTERSIYPTSPVAPDDAEIVQVSDDGRTIVFQMPVASTGPDRIEASTPITIRYEDEDVDDDGILDAGEDENDDGVLSRRVVREQDGVQRVLGATDVISDAQFTLLPNLNEDDDRLTTLTIRLEAFKTYGPGDQQLVQAELEGSVDIVN